MNYLKGGVGTSRHHDEAMDIGKPLTPKSEMPRDSYGSLAVSLQAVRGLCPHGKCFKRRGHGGDCYPT